MEIPAFTLSERPGRDAAQRFIRHLRRLAKLDPEAAEVQKELERLEGDLQGWLDRMDDTISREEEKEEPDEERLDRLQEQHDTLEEAQTALGDQEIADAIEALERAFPPRPPRESAKGIP